MAKALKTVRKARGLSQEAFSDVSSRTYMSTLERDLKSPTLNKLAELCEVMGVHPLTLLTLAYIGDSPHKAEELLAQVRRELGKVCKTPLRAREFIPSGVFCLLKRSRVLESSAPNAASTRLPALHGHLAQCRRTHPCARRICRRAIHKLPSANSIVSRAVFLASPR